MARAGLSDGWKCLFANDIDPKKGATYIANWGSKEFKLADVHKIRSADLPGRADLAWASFPCQDLSLAGNGAGLDGERSGAFWGFWNAIHTLRGQRRLPPMLVLENVCGTLTSHGGRDFAEIARALGSLRYDFGALVIDAALFVPQSRPRLFIVAVHQSQMVPESLKDIWASNLWHPKALRAAHQILAPDLRKRWIWWRLPTPEPHGEVLADIIEENPTDVKWHSSEETNRLLGQMSSANLAKVNEAKNFGSVRVGTIYRRTRRDENGGKIQRAEVRFDDVAGCLRTPAGGSSRQIILLVNGHNVRSRLLSGIEAARLMGLSRDFMPNDYCLPKNYNEAYHLVGDGVVVPVVRHLATNLLEKIISMATHTPVLIAAE